MRFSKEQYALHIHICTVATAMQIFALSATMSCTGVVPALILSTGRHMHCCTYGSQRKLQGAKDTMRTSELNLCSCTRFCTKQTIAETLRLKQDPMNRHGSKMTFTCNLPWPNAHASLASE